MCVSPIISLNISSLSEDSFCELSLRAFFTFLYQVFGPFLFNFKNYLFIEDISSLSVLSVLNIFAQANSLFIL